MTIDLKKIEKISKALGDPYRLKMLEAIRNEKDWLPCSSIVETFNLAQSTVSHHMKQLIDADLVVLEKDGRCARYMVNTPVFQEYIEFLNQLK